MNIPPPEFFKEEEGLIDDDLESLVFVVNYLSNDYDLVDYKFRNMCQVIKNSIRGGHTIAMETLVEDGSTNGSTNIECWFEVEMYMKLDPH